MPLPSRARGRRSHRSQPSLARARAPHTPPGSHRPSTGASSHSQVYRGPARGPSLDPACPPLPLLQSDSQHLSKSYPLNALGSFRLPSLCLCSSLCLEFLQSTHPQTSALPIRSSPVLPSQSSSRNSSQTLLHTDSPNNHLPAMGFV